MLFTKSKTILFDSKPEACFTKLFWRLCNTIFYLYRSNKKWLIVLQMRYASNVIHIHLVVITYIYITFEFWAENLKRGNPNPWWYYSLELASREIVSIALALDKGIIDHNMRHSNKNIFGTYQSWMAYLFPRAKQWHLNETNGYFTRL